METEFDDYTDPFSGRCTYCDRHCVGTVCDRCARACGESDDLSPDMCDAYDYDDYGDYDDGDDE